MFKYEAYFKRSSAGKCLGALLFNAYINDVTNIYLNAKYVLYADDASIFVSGTNCTDIEYETNLMLSKLRDWSIMNQLEINTNKTKAVLFRPKNKPVNSNINIMYGEKR